MAKETTQIKIDIELHKKLKVMSCIFEISLQDLIERLLEKQINEELKKMESKKNFDSSYFAVKNYLSSKGKE